MCSGLQIYCLTKWGEGNNQALTTVRLHDRSTSTILRGKQTKGGKAAGYCCQTLGKFEYNSKCSPTRQSLAF